MQFLVRRETDEESFILASFVKGATSGGIEICGSGWLDFEDGKERCEQFRFKAKL